MWMFFAIACQQPEPPPLVPDAWADTDAVDVLVVIDDSISMEGEQPLVADQADGIAAALAGLDARVVVVTTSLDDDTDAVSLVGDPVALTDLEIADGLRDRLHVGTDGNDKERGLQAAFGAAILPDVLREDARLLVVVISDEDDCSDDHVLDGQPPDTCYLRSVDLPPVADWVGQLQDLKPAAELVRFVSLVPLDATCLNAAPGTRYVEAAALTNGVVGDLCTSTWGDAVGMAL